MPDKTPFVINDRRKFTAEGELRPDVPHSEPAHPSEEQAPKPVAEPAAEAKAPIPFPSPAAETSLQKLQPPISPMTSTFLRRPPPSRPTRPTAPTTPPSTASTLPSAPPTLAWNACPR